jgi:hypothetical protein
MARTVWVKHGACSFKQALVKVGDVEEVIIDKRQRGIFEQDALDGVYGVVENSLYSMSHQYITLSCRTLSSIK